MKKTLVVTLALLMSIAVSACGSKATSNEGSSTTASETAAPTVTQEQAVPDENGIVFPTAEPEQKKVSIHSSRDYQMAAQLITAKNKGYFKEAGLDVDITWYQTASDIPTAMIAGDIDVAFGSWTNPMQVQAYGVDCKVLATLGDPSGTLSLIVSKESGIDSVDDIKDKTITLTNAAIVTRTLKNICKLYNLDYDALNIVNTAPSDGLASFMNGQVDAIFTWQPYCAQAIEAGGIEIINGAYDYSNGQSKKVEDLYISGCTFYVSQKYLSKNPNTCARLMWALAKAEVDLEKDENLKDIAALTYEDMSLTAASIAEANLISMDYSMKFTEKWANTLVSEIPYYVEIGSIPVAFDGLKILDTSVLEAVAPEWVEKSYR